MDLYTDVFPILKQENAKAVAYIIVDFLNRPNFLFSLQVVLARFGSNSNRTTIQTDIQRTDTAIQDI